MKNIYRFKKLRHRQCWLVFLSLLPLFCSCQSQGPPLTPEARLFVQEVQKTISELSALLVKQIPAKNISAINTVLHKFYYAEKKKGRMIFRLNVLDNTGVILTAYPLNPAIGQYFGQYSSVSQALQKKRIGQEKLILANGSTIFSVCAPLLEQDKVVGALSLVFDPETAKEKWGITPEFFLAINFNHNY